MSALFYNCSNLTSLDVSNFDTENVTNMSYMFDNCSNLTSLDLSNFNTLNVTDMKSMFSGCSNIESIYVSDAWNTEKVTSSSGMFSYCSNIIGEDYYTVYSSYFRDVAKAHYNAGGYLRDAATKNEPRAYAVLDGRYLTFYYDNESLTHAGTIYKTFRTGEKTGAWASNAGTITRVTIDSSFANCTGIKSMAYWFDGFTSLLRFTGIENLNTENVEDMSYMFRNIKTMEGIDVTNLKTKKVKNMAYMFRGCGATSLDLSKFNTENVTNMDHIFSACSSLTFLDVSSFNTKNVTDMGYMFYGCDKLTSLNVSDFTTQNVTNMYGMFYSCSNLTSLDVSNFNTQNVTDMQYMFSNCNNLTSLDVSKFNTQNVTNMYQMFRGCSSLTALDVSNFNTQNVSNMSYMFYGCSKLSSLDVSNFNTQNVTKMGYMFSGCNNLTSLDLSSFNTEITKDFSYMFSGCKNLETIYVGDDWFTVNATNTGSMFYGCSSIEGQDGTKYSKSSANDKTMAHYGTGGYLTYIDNRKRSTFTTNAGGWASFTPAFNCTLSDGAKAYIVNNIRETDDKVIARSVTTLAKGVGYFVKGKKSTEYTATSTGQVTTQTDGNKIVGCLTNTVLDSSVQSNTMYFLGVKNGVAGMYYVSGKMTIPAGKAYLQSESSLVLNWLNIEIEDEDVPTNINEIAGDGEGNLGVRKYIKDGKLVIERNDAEYSVSGARIK